MRKIIFVLALLLTSNAYADTCATNMMPAFTANQAVQLCTKLNDSIAESLIPQSDNAIDVGSSTKGFRSGYFDTSVLTPLLIPPGDLVIRVDADAQRLYTIGATSDTALTQTFGDGGTTAAQTLTLLSSTADADDDSYIAMCGGGANSTTRGACIQVYGNETSAGAATVTSGGLATSHINFDLGHASSTARVRNTGGSAVVTMTNTGEVTSAGTSSIGWAVVAGADTACNTTCTSACVFGVNTASLTADIVDCADATADECMCAGAS